MVNLDELRERLTTKEERLRILEEVNDGAYLSLEVGRGDVSKKGLTREDLLLDRIKYLGILLTLSFERMEILEDEK